jgi:hypothetical protein
MTVSKEVPRERRCVIKKMVTEASEKLQRSLYKVNMICKNYNFKNF